MRLKTFLATYVLFLLILFSTISIVSVYMTNSQMNMLREKSTRDYQTISASLVRDIANLYSRSAGHVGMDFSNSVESLVRGYARYYRAHNINILLTDLSLTEQQNSNGLDAEIAFIQREYEHFIRITGILPPPFQFFRLDYYFNITSNITDMQNIQRILLIFSIIFSMIAALGLYFILQRIFSPLIIVDRTSRKIADGNYGERIKIRGKNELSSMAESFNRMAEEIENQIRILEDEAKSKQQFIDNFAHEIRTPLTSIYGYAEYLQKAPYSEDDTIESTQYIMDESNHMKKIANSLLELATLRNYTPIKSDISIKHLFDDIQQTLKKSLHERKIRLICRNDVDVLEGQEELIKSLILNLCLNAIKACPENDGVIYLEANRQDENVILSVSDNGCGISEEDISKITEPFYRADKSRSREHGSIGLGLTLCKQIAEVHRAEMTIESTIDVGTKIKITFTTP